MKAFRQAVESKDIAALTALLAPDVVFSSPVSFKPYRGREEVGWILATVATIFEDFVYTAELDDGRRSVLCFRTRIGDRAAEGIDLIERDGDGAVTALTVFIRPLSAVQALAAAMAERWGKRPAG